jgi:hypothetical protein
MQYHDKRSRRFRPQGSIAGKHYSNRSREARVATTPAKLPSSVTERACYLPPAKKPFIFLNHELFASGQCVIPPCQAPAGRPAAAPRALKTPHFSFILLVAAGSSQVRDGFWIARAGNSGACHN